MIKTGICVPSVVADPQAFLSGAGPSPDDIIERWRQAKAGSKAAPVCLSTVRRYRDVARMLEIKFCNEACVEPSTFSPVQVVEKLFVHSDKLAKSTWTSYRSAMIFHLDERVRSFEDRKSPKEDYWSYRRALAALICIQRSPRASSVPIVKRAATMTNSRYERLVKSLGQSRSTVARDFAVATMVTGLRPCEWAEAILRPAEQADMPLSQDPNGYSALTIQTGKRKGENTIEVRTLLLKRGLEHDAVEKHMRAFASAKNKKKTKGGRGLASKGHELMIKNCSELIKKKCKELWPNKPSCWATLYTLRSQARANFAKLHGVEVAAAMLGHSVRVSQVWYARKRSASLGDGTDMVAPGKDVLERAATFATARLRPDFSCGQKPDNPVFAEEDFDEDDSIDTDRTGGGTY